MCSAALGGPSFLLFNFLAYHHNALNILDEIIFEGLFLNLRRSETIGAMIL